MIFVPSKVFFVDCQSNLYRALTLAICIYLCFAGKVLFQFLAFGFISHAFRTLNKARFCFQR